MTQKITKRQNLFALLAIEEVANNPQLKGFVEHEIELLEKRSTKRAEKPSKKQTENDSIKASILKAMEADKMYQIKDMIRKFDFLREMSNQRVAVLVRQLMDDGFITRIEDKRVAYFALAN